MRRVIIKLLSWLQEVTTDKSWMLGIFIVLWLASTCAIYFSKPWESSDYVLDNGKIEQKYNQIDYKEMGNGRGQVMAAYDALKLFSISNDEVVELELNSLENKAAYALMFLAPIFTFIAILQFFIGRILLFFVRIGIENEKHIVLLGLGSWGLHYARSLSNSGKKVVVIDKNPSEQAVEEVIKSWTNKGQQPIQLIIGDCLDKKILKQANVGSCSKVLPLLGYEEGGGDAANIDAAYEVRKVLKEVKVDAKGELPVILLPVEDIRLATSLATYKRFSEHHGEVEIRFFNIMQQAVVRHLHQFPPELYADIFKQDNIHFSIYGLGDFAINLIYVIAHLGHYRTWEEDAYVKNKKVQSKRVQITIYDQKEQADAMGDLKALFPQLEQVIDVNYKQTSLMALDFAAELANPVTQHFFCMSDEALAVRYATKLRKNQMLTTLSNTPIFVRSLDGKGLSRLIESNCGEDEWPDSIFPLVLLPNKLGEQDYFSKDIDNLARCLNYSKVNGFDEEEKEELWETLASDFKHSSFYQAFYLNVRLRSIGYQWLPNKSKAESCRSWDDEGNASLYHHIAHLEHDRWKSERWLLGWNKGDIRTIEDIERSHPELEGKEEYKKWKPTYDIRQAKNIAKYIEQAECKLIKTEVVCQATQVNHNTIYMFNLLDHEARKSASIIIQENRCEQVIALLPLPYEIIHALLPIVWKDKSEHGICAEQTLAEISQLTGQVGLYVEMPLQHPFSEWEKKEIPKELPKESLTEEDELIKKEYNDWMKLLQGWLAEANLLTNEYIRIRTSKKPEILDESCPVAWKSTFLTKPGLKENISAKR